MGKDIHGSSRRHVKVVLARESKTLISEGLRNWLIAWVMPIVWKHTTQVRHLNTCFTLWPIIHVERAPPWNTWKQIYLISPAFRCRRENHKTWRKPTEAGLDWKPKFGHCTQSAWFTHDGLHLHMCKYTNLAMILILMLNLFTKVWNFLVFHRL